MLHLSFPPDFLFVNTKLLSSSGSFLSPPSSVVSCVESNYPLESGIKTVLDNAKHHTVLVDEVREHGKQLPFGEVGGSKGREF